MERPEVVSVIVTDGNTKSTHVTTSLTLGEVLFAWEDYIWPMVPYQIYRLPQPTADFPMGNFDFMWMEDYCRYLFGTVNALTSN